MPLPSSDHEVECIPQAELFDPGHHAAGNNAAHATTLDHERELASSLLSPGCEHCSRASRINSEDWVVAGPSFHVCSERSKGAHT